MPTNDIQEWSGYSQLPWDGTVDETETSGHASNNHYAIAQRSALLAYIAGQDGATPADGKIWKYNGSTYSVDHSRVGSILRGIWAYDDSNIFAVGEAGTGALYTGSWADNDPGGSKDLYGVMGASDQIVWAVGYEGRIRKTTNGGGSWASQHTGNSTDQFIDIWVLDDQNAWAVGGDSTSGSPWTALIYSTSNGGSSWNSDTVLGNSLLSVHGFAADDIWAAGNNTSSSTLVHWNGSTWTDRKAELPGLSGYNLTAVWGPNPENLYVAGWGSTGKTAIWRLSGGVWTKIYEDLGAAYIISDIQAALGTPVRVVAPSNKILRLDFETSSVASYRLDMGRQPERNGTYTITVTEPTSTSTSYEIYGSHSGVFGGEEEIILSTTDESGAITEKYRHYLFKCYLSGTVSRSPYIDKIAMAFPA